MSPLYIIYCKLISNLNKIRFSTIILIIVSVSSTYTYPEITGNGYIFSSSGEPIPFASVINARTKSWSVTDESGFFQIPAGTNIKDSLAVFRIGFLTSYQRIEKPGNLKIFLKQMVLPIDSVHIDGKREIGLNKINFLAMDALSRNNALNRLPGATIRTYGGLSGITTLSMDGGQPTHTKVVLDGIDLTDIQNGLTDLSNIPISTLQNINLGRSPNIRFGSGSFDGVIHIRSLINNSYFSISNGSFGFIDGSGGFRQSSQNTNFQMQAGQTTSKGNYLFNHNYSNHSRENNDYKQRFISSQYQRQLNPNRFIKGSILSVWCNRGVAGSLTFPSPNARRNNTLFLSGIEIVEMIERGHLRIATFQRSSDEIFKDTDLGTNSRHDVSSTGLDFNTGYHLNKNIELEGLFSTKFESITSTDIGQKKRKSNAVGLQVSIRPISSLILRPGTRIDFIDKKRVSTFDFKSIINSQNFGNFTIIVGSGFHSPTFNDLYWPADPYSQGNPNLEMEKSKFKIIRWENRIGKYINYKIEFRDRKSDNLILWAPDNNYFWKPQNLDKAYRRNLIISASIPENRYYWNISGTIRKTDTEDFRTGKPLEFIPNASGNIILSYTLENIRLELQSNYTGERFYQGYGSNFEINDRTIDPFINLNAGALFTLSLFKYSIQLHLMAENILNKDIAFFPDYPEPGLGIKARITIKL